MIGGLFMNGKHLLKDIGMVGTIIGFVMFLLGYQNYRRASQAYDAIQTGVELFGKAPSTDMSIDIWLGQMHNYKIVFITGAVIFAVSIIIFIAGLIKNKGK